LLAWLRSALPTLLVLMALGGFALWGHHTGWTFPSFASLFGGGPAAKDDWCAEHSVPESLCVECRPGLLPRPPAYGWCRKHGVHDCPFEHPDVAQLKALPAITRADLDRAQRARDFALRKENSKTCKLHPRRIQVASHSILEKLGIELAPVWQAPVEESLAASGELTYDPTRVAQLAAPLPGRVWKVEEAGHLGRAVRQGDVLALVDAAEVGRAKSEFLQAVGHWELKSGALARLRSAYASGALPEARFREAEGAARAAHIRLVAAEQALLNLGLPIRAEQVKGLDPEQLARRVQFLGLPEAYAKTLDPGTTTANLIPVRAPFDGVVVARQVALGEMADASRTLFVVADTSRLWLTLHVPQDSLKPFREQNPRLLLSGKPVRFSPDGTNAEVGGTITWVGTAVDERTRTLQVRAVVPNPDGRLQANTFGAGRVVLRREDKAVVVPNEAVHWEGACHVVFVWDKRASEPDAPKVFHVRTILPGVRSGPNTEVIAGVLPGEMVATRNSGVLRAELLKHNLGEG
jgi:cobalt-zinc-cadmium efflux system membrane fusion protein